MARSEKGAAAKRQRRSQEERREEADRRMVDATIEIIAEKGFGGLILSDVGRRAGYSMTLPVHYYKTKEALILLTAERIISDYTKVLQQEIEGVVGLEAIRAFVRTYLRYAEEHPVKRRALFMITSEAAVASSLKDSVAALARSGAATLARMIRDGQARNEVEPMVDAEAYGTLIFAWLRGIISLWAVDATLELGRLAAGVEGTILRALLNRGDIPGAA